MFTDALDDTATQDTASPIQTSEEQTSQSSADDEINWTFSAALDLDQGALFLALLRWALFDWRLLSFADIDAVVWEELGVSKQDIKSVEVFSSSRMDEKNQKETKLWLGKLIRKAAYLNWSVAQLRDAVRQSNGGAQWRREQEQAVVAFWQRNRESIHRNRVQDSYFSRSAGAQLNIKYRIDQVQNATNLAEIQNTVGIVEIQKPSVASEKIAFEVDKQSLEMVLGTLCAIEKRIQAFTQ